MKMFEGTLQVETIRGRRGPFNVGKLITDIGEFKVKDKELDRNRLDPPCLAQAASAADANDGTGFPLRRAAMTFAR